MAMITTGSPEQSTTALMHPIAITTPKKTATPPKTGTGVRWSLRASGLSTMFFNRAIFTSLGWIQPTKKRAIKKGMMTV